MLTIVSLENKYSFKNIRPSFDAHYIQFKQCVIFFMLQICNMMNAPADEYFTFQVNPVMLIIITIVQKHTMLATNRLYS